MRSRDRIQAAHNNYEEDDSRIMANDPYLVAKAFGLMLLLFIFMAAGWYLVIQYPKQFFGFNAALLVISVIVWAVKRTINNVIKR